MNLEIIKKEIERLSTLIKLYIECKDDFTEGFFEENMLKFTTLKSALEKQIPKKPYKVKEHKQNDYYCSVCRRYLGDEMELKYACLQPEYCQHCGQALDWSDTE